MIIKWSVEKTHSVEIEMKIKLIKRMNGKKRKVNEEEDVVRQEVIKII